MVLKRQERGSGRALVVSAPRGSSEVGTQCGKALDHEELGSVPRLRYFFVLEHPGIVVRDEHSIESSGERRINVGLGTVADHPGHVWSEAVLLRNGAVGGLVFF